MAKLCYNDSGQGFNVLEILIFGLILMEPTRRRGRRILKVKYGEG